MECARPSCDDDWSCHLSGSIEVKFEFAKFKSCQAISPTCIWSRWEQAQLATLMSSPLKSVCVLGHRLYYYESH